MIHNPTESDGASILDAVLVQEILREHRDGNEPLVTYQTATPCLIALGRPLSLAIVKDLAVDVRNLGGRSVAPLSKFLKEADDYIKRRLARPNLKATAAAKACAARGRGAAA